MIPAVEIRRAEAIIDRSGVVEELEALLRPTDPRSGRQIGRPRDISARTVLVGVLLAAGHGKNLHLRQVHRTLTHSISRSQQERLGVRFERRGEHLGPRKRVLTYHHFSRLLCAVTRKVTATVDADGTDASGAYLQSIVDRLIAASIDAGPEPSGHWAIDGTGIDTWANGLKSAARRADPDAQWGYRSPTPQKSMSEKFFGYDLYGFTIVPPQPPAGSSTRTSSVASWCAPHHLMTPRHRSPASTRCSAPGFPSSGSSSIAASPTRPMPAGQPSYATGASTRPSTCTPTNTVASTTTASR